MRKQTPVGVRINPSFKKKCDETFRRLGMNTHAGINLFLTQMRLHQGIPFEVALIDAKNMIMTEEKSISLIIKTDEETKRICTELAKKAGLNLSRAITMYLVQVVDKQAIPFTILSNEKV